MQSGALLCLFEMSVTQKDPIQELLLSSLRCKEAL